MEVTLKFNLPEDEYEYNMARKGHDAVSVIDETLAQLREWIKHGNNFKTPKEALDGIRGFIHDELDDRADRVESV